MSDAVDLPINASAASAETPGQFLRPPAIIRTDPCNDIQPFIEYLWLSQSAMCRSLYTDTFPMGAATKEVEDAWIQRYFSPETFHEQGGRFLKQVLVSIAMYNESRLDTFAKEWIAKNPDLLEDRAIRNEICGPGPYPQPKKLFYKEDEGDHDEAFLSRSVQWIRWLLTRQEDSRQVNPPSTSPANIPSTSGTGVGDECAIQSSPLASPTITDLSMQPALSEGHQETALPSPGTILRSMSCSGDSRIASQACHTATYASGKKERPESTCGVRQAGYPAADNCNSKRNESSRQGAANRMPRPEHAENTVTGPHHFAPSQGPPGLSVPPGGAKRQFLNGREYQFYPQFGGPILVPYQPMPHMLPSQYYTVGHEPQQHHEFGSQTHRGRGRGNRGVGRARGSQSEVHAHGMDPHSFQRLPHDQGRRWHHVGDGHRSSTYSHEHGSRWRDQEGSPPDRRVFSDQLPALNRPFFPTGQPVLDALTGNGVEGQHRDRRLSQPAHGHSSTIRPGHSTRSNGNDANAPSCRPDFIPPSRTDVTDLVAHRDSWAVPDDVVLQMLVDRYPTGDFSFRPAYSPRSVFVIVGSNVLAQIILNEQPLRDFGVKFQVPYRFLDPEYKSKDQKYREFFGSRYASPAVSQDHQPESTRASRGPAHRGSFGENVAPRSQNQPRHDRVSGRRPSGMTEPWSGAQRTSFDRKMDAFDVPAVYRHRRFSNMTGSQEAPPQDARDGRQATVKNDGLQALSEDATPSVSGSTSPRKINKKKKNQKNNKDRRVSNATFGPTDPTGDIWATDDGALRSAGGTGRPTVNLTTAEGSQTVKASKRNRTQHSKRLSADDVESQPQLDDDRKTNDAADAECSIPTTNKATSNTAMMVKGEVDETARNAMATTSLLPKDAGLLSTDKTDHASAPMASMSSPIKNIPDESPILPDDTDKRADDNAVARQDIEDARETAAPITPNNDAEDTAVIVDHDQHGPTGEVASNALTKHVHAGRTEDSKSTTGLDSPSVFSTPTGTPVSRSLTPTIAKDPSPKPTDDVDDSFRTAAETPEHDKSFSDLPKTKSPSVMTETGAIDETKATQCLQTSIDKNVISRIGSPQADDVAKEALEEEDDSTTTLAQDSAMQNSTKDTTCTEAPTLPTQAQGKKAELSKSGPKQTESLSPFAKQTQSKKKAKKSKAAKGKNKPKVDSVQKDQTFEFIGQDQTWIQTNKGDVDKAKKTCPDQMNQTETELHATGLGISLGSEPKTNLMPQSSEQTSVAANIQQEPQNCVPPRAEPAKMFQFGKPNEPGEETSFKSNKGFFQSATARLAGAFGSNPAVTDKSFNVSGDSERTVPKSVGQAAGGIVHSHYQDVTTGLQDTGRSPKAHGPPTQDSDARSSAQEGHTKAQELGNLTAKSRKRELPMTPAGEHDQVSKATSKSEQPKKSRKQETAHARNESTQSQHTGAKDIQHADGSGTSSNRTITPSPNATSVTTSELSRATVVSSSTSTLVKAPTNKLSMRKKKTPRLQQASTEATLLGGTEASDSDYKVAADTKLLHLRGSTPRKMSKDATEADQLRSSKDTEVQVQESQRKLKEMEHKEKLIKLRRAGDQEGIDKEEQRWEQELHLASLVAQVARAALEDSTSETDKVLTPETGSSSREQTPDATRNDSCVVGRIPGYLAQKHQSLNPLLDQAMAERKPEAIPTLSQTQQRATETMYDRLTDTRTFDDLLDEVRGISGRKCIEQRIPVEEGVGDLPENLQVLAYSWMSKNVMPVKGNWIIRSMMDGSGTTKFLLESPGSPEIQLYASSRMKEGDLV